MRYTQWMRGLRFGMIALVVGGLLTAGSAVPAVQAQADCDETIDYVDVGSGAFSDREYADAVEAFTCAIVLNPTEYEGYLRRSEAALLAGDYVMALLDRSESIGLAFNDWSLIEEALIEDYTANIEANRQDVDMLVLRSFAYLFANRTEEALSDLAAILKVDFESAYAWIFRALVDNVSTSGEDDLAGLLADFERAVAFEPENPAVYTIIGSLLINRDPSTTDGLAYLERALAVDPSYPYAYYVRASYNLAVEAPEAAIQDYTAALENSFTPVFRVLSERAALYTAIQDYEAALADYDTLIALYPDTLSYYEERIAIFMQRGDLESVVAEYDRLVALNPQSANNFLSRGTYRLLLNDSAGGAEDFLEYTQLLETDAVQGGELKLGDALTITMSQGRNHYFTFEATAGDVLDISAISPDRLVDPLLVIVDADGEPVITNDDVDADVQDYNSLIVWEVPADGTYTLIVSHAAAGSEGAVELSIGLHGVERRGSDA